MYLQQEKKSPLIQRKTSLFYIQDTTKGLHKNKIRFHAKALCINKNKFFWCLKDDLFSVMIGEHSEDDDEFLRRILE